MRPSMHTKAHSFSLSHKPRQPPFEKLLERPSPERIFCYSNMIRYALRRRSCLSPFCQLRSKNKPNWRLRSNTSLLFATSQCTCNLRDEIAVSYSNIVKSSVVHTEGKPAIFLRFEYNLQASFCTATLIYFIS